MTLPRKAVADRLFIGGEWRDAADGGSFAVEDPGNGEHLATVADAGVADAHAALDVAERSAPAWAATDPRTRAEILRAAYELLTERSEDLAELITLEMGKSLEEAKAEVAYGAEFFRWFGEEAARIRGDYRTDPGSAAGRILITRQPVGVSVLITPWNFPLAMAARKVGPVIAAGCTAVLKPAPATPLTTLLCAELLAEAGLPPGVLNVLPTDRADEVVRALLADSRVRKLSFTGSTAVGRRLLKQAAENVLRTSMELGGNAPFLVFDDADLEIAIDAAVIAKMRNIGQSCVAANRFLVHHRVFDAFAGALAERLDSLRLGHGLDPSTHVGPVIDAGARLRISGLVESASDAGATTITDGTTWEGPGYFIRPAALVVEDPTHDIVRNEIFGPIAPIMPFKDEDDAIRLANATSAGLAAYLCTRNFDRAMRVGEALEVGMVGLNRGVVSNPAAPFGGGKHSGLGREGGHEGIEEFLELKYMTFAL